jgi:hypothetical protein
MTGAVHPKVDKSDALARSMKAMRSSDLLNDEEASLLGQPLIHASGGLSGLGSRQLSDNDKFACMAKYLLNYDVFKQVTTPCMHAIGQSLVVMRGNLLLLSGRRASRGPQFTGRRGGPRS